MRVKASDPSHPIICAQCRAPSLPSSLFSLIPVKLLCILPPLVLSHSAPIPSQNLLTFFRGCRSTDPHFKREKCAATPAVPKSAALFAKDTRACT